MYNSRELKASPDPKKPAQPKDVIVDPMGQWKHPGKVTKIPSNKITMKGVPYPVLGIDDLGNYQVMHPGMDYVFPGNSVTEFPQMQTGGMLATSSYNIPLQKQYTPAELKKFDEYNRLNPDSNLENIIEIVDPTGISSWDDVYRSYKQSGMSPETYLEIVGALPLLGKVGKTAKGFSALAKTSRQAKSLNKFTNAMQAASLAGKASDTYQAYDQYQKKDGGWLDEVEEFRRGGQKGLKKFTSKNIKTSVNKLMLRNETLFGEPGKKIYDPNAKGWLDKYK